MSDAAMQHTEVEEAATFAIPNSWITFIAKYGFATFMAMGLLYYLAFYIVEPMRKDQQSFMQSVIKTNELNAQTHMAAAQSMAQLTDVQRTQAATLNTLTEQQKQTIQIMQQIRDDQRAGAWNKGHQ